MTARGDDRRVHLAQRVRLGDVTPRGRLRLDAIARYLQDIASDDGDDAGLPTGHGWILRKLALTVDRLPALAEDVELTTHCTGVGGRWAERTTTIGTGAGVAITSRAVWVYVDVTTGAPRALPAEFFVTYGVGVREHRVSARLALAPWPRDVVPEPWGLRRTDIDVYGHVNNANYWAPVEEWLAGPGAGRRITAAEIEFGAGIGPDDPCEIGVGATGTDATFWFLVAGETRATARVRFAGT